MEGTLLLAEGVSGRCPLLPREVVLLGRGNSGLTIGGNPKGGPLLPITLAPLTPLTPAGKHSNVNPRGEWVWMDPPIRGVTTNRRRGYKTDM